MGGQAHTGVHTSGASRATASLPPRGAAHSHAGRREVAGGRRLQRDAAVGVGADVEPQRAVVCGGSAGAGGAAPGAQPVRSKPEGHAGCGRGRQAGVAVAGSRRGGHMQGPRLASATARVWPRRCAPKFMLCVCAPVRIRMALVTGSVVVYFSTMLSPGLMVSGAETMVGRGPLVRYGGLQAQGAGRARGGSNTGRQMQRQCGPQQAKAAPVRHPLPPERTCKSRRCGRC